MNKFFIIHNNYQDGLRLHTLEAFESIEKAEEYIRRMVGNGTGYFGIVQLRKQFSAVVNLVETQMSNETIFTCPLCKCDMRDNKHGLDTGDLYEDEGGKVQTYWKVYLL